MITRKVMKMHHDGLESLHMSLQLEETPTPIENSRHLIPCGRGILTLTTSNAGAGSGASTGVVLTLQVQAGTTGGVSAESVIS